MRAGINFGQIDWFCHEDFVSVPSQVEVTRHGRVVAKIVPPATADRAERRKAAVEWILDNKRQGRWTGLTIEDIISARDEGRP
jgi:hypothetical protein